MDPLFCLGLEDLNDLVYYGTSSSLVIKAIERNRVALLGALMSMRSMANVLVDDRHTILELAICARSSDDIFRIILSKGALVNVRSAIDNEYLLNKAIKSGLFSVVKMMLECGANPNFSNDLGETAMHSAAMMGRKDMYDLLVSFGGDAMRMDRVHFTPSHYLCMFE